MDGGTLLGLLKQQRQRVGDHGGLVFAFNLNGVARVYEEAVAPWRYGGQCDVCSDAGAGLDWGQKADLVVAVVDGASRAFWDDADLAAHHREERERQQAVGDGSAGGRLAFGPFHVNMDPLPVACELGEGVDHRLVDRHPVGGTNLLPDEISDGGEGVGIGGHGMGSENDRK